MDTEALRQWLYAPSAPDIPTSFTDWLAQTPDVAQARLNTPLDFLDHAYGHTPARVLEAGLRGWCKASIIGNASWQEVFNELTPQASRYLLELLHLDSELGCVHWGASTYDLLWRAVSCRLDGRAAHEPIVFLTTDTEFYSLTRQLNLLASQARPPAGSSSSAREWCPAVNVRVEAVPAEPVDTLLERLQVEALRLAPDVVYVSQLTYLNQVTLVPDPSTFLAQLAETLAKAAQQQFEASQQGARDPRPEHAPLLLLDGYHAFMALPTDLHGAFACAPVAEGAVTVGYLGGLLKHAGCGANASFLVASAAWRPRPLWSGWLADPSVFGARSPGLRLVTSAEVEDAGGGEEAQSRRGGVGFSLGLELQGGTPSYVLPMRCFVHLMDCLKQGPKAQGAAERGEQGWCISVADMHRHVLRLQRRFVQGLRRMEERGAAPLLRAGQLVNMRPEAQAAEEDDEESDTGGETRSHTLAFAMSGGVDEAAELVDELARRGIAVDARRGHVRVGFCFQHGPQDVDRLLEVLLGAC